MKKPKESFRIDFYSFIVLFFSYFIYEGYSNYQTKEFNSQCFDRIRKEGIERVTVYYGSDFDKKVSTITNNDCNELLGNTLLMGQTHRFGRVSLNRAYSAKIVLKNGSMVPFYFFDKNGESYVFKFSRIRNSGTGYRNDNLKEFMNECLN